MGLGINIANILSKLIESPNININCIDLSKNRLGDEGAKALSKDLSKSRTLVHLDISSNEIKKEGATALFESLKSNQTINCLYLGNDKGVYRNFLYGNAVASLNDLLICHQQLTILDLKFVSLGDKGIAIIHEGIIKSNTLRVLNLAHNTFTSVSNPTLVDIMGRSGIRRLDLSQNFLGDTLKYELNKSTKERIFLQSQLNLGNCGFSSIGASILFEVLIKDPCLDTLVLDGQKFNDKDFMLLSEFLSNSTSLKVFSLKSSELGDNGAAAIAIGIVDNPFINELHLADNKIMVMVKET